MVQFFPDEFITTFQFPSSVLQLIMSLSHQVAICLYNITIEETLNKDVDRQMTHRALIILLPW